MSFEFTDRSSMRLVYRLSEELANDPGQVADTQSLTLDPTRPEVGLKGSCGLFGSPEWWSSIDSGRIRKKIVSGVITRIYVAGQDRSELPNAFDIRCDDGGTQMEGIYVNSKEDVVLYEVGKRVDVVYVLDEMKAPSSNGMADYLDIVFEVYVAGG